MVEFYVTLKKYLLLAWIDFYLPSFFMFIELYLITKSVFAFFVFSYITCNMLAAFVHLEFQLSLYLINFCLFNLQLKRSYLFIT